MASDYTLNLRCALGAARRGSLMMTVPSLRNASTQASRSEKKRRGLYEGLPTTSIYGDRLQREETRHF